MKAHDESKFFGLSASAENYLDIIRSKPDRYFSVPKVSANFDNEASMPRQIHTQSDFSLFFRPVHQNDLWCFECFTTEDGINHLGLQETVCCHLLCESCIIEKIREAFTLNENLKCPHCYKVLLKLV